MQHSNNRSKRAIPTALCSAQCGGLKTLVNVTSNRLTVRVEHADDGMPAGTPGRAIRPADRTGTGHGLGT